MTGIKFKFVTAIVSVALLSGCPPKKSVRVNRDVQVIEIGGASRKYRLLEENENIEEVSEASIELIAQSDFELLRSNYSFGVDPFTGRNKLLTFRHRYNEYLYCHITVSKYQYQVIFREVEQGYKTGVFLTTQDQRKEISDLTVKIKHYAQTKYPEKQIKLQNYEY